MLLCSLLFFVPVPLFNFGLVFIFAPFIAGCITKKYFCQSVREGILTAGIATTVQIIILILVLSFIMPEIYIKIDLFELLIFFMIFCLNIIFYICGNVSTSIKTVVTQDK